MGGLTNVAKNHMFFSLLRDKLRSALASLVKMEHYVKGGKSFSMKFMHEATEALC